MCIRDRVNSGGRRRKARIWVKGMAVGFGMLLCLVGLCIFAYWSSCPLPKNSDPISVEISPGASTRDIAAILHENQIIRSRFIFRVISRGLKADGRDVYKRQGSYTTPETVLGNSGLRTRLSITAPTPTCPVRGSPVASPMISRDSRFTSVSYTHLDVYKRQLYLLAMIKLCGL